MSRTVRLAAAVALAAGALTVPTMADASGSGASRLTQIRAGAHDGYDRLVFEFSGALPSHTFVAWSDRVEQDGSGDTVPAAGSAFLQIGLSGVTGLTSSYASTFGEHRRSLGLPNLNEVVHAGEFEGMISFGAALMTRTSYTVTRLTKPSRVVIDVRNDYRRTTVPVAFMRGAQELADVRREVPAAAPATGALHRLFAGPTAAERAAGYEVVRNEITGFTGLTIRDGIARVRLVGPCRGGYGAFTVANHVHGTLMPFATVDHVKIADQDGQTGDPTGRTSSLPGCLEP